MPTTTDSTSRRMPKVSGSMDEFYRSHRTQVTPSKIEPDLSSLQQPQAPISAPLPDPVSTTNQNTHPSPESNYKRSSSFKHSIQRQRSSRILETTFSSKQQTEPSSFSPTPELVEGADPSMVCPVAYRGMEVIFASCRNVIYCICARTRVVLQTLDYHQDDNNSTTIVSLLAHPLTGMVAVTLSNGMIYTFHPKPTQSKKTVSNPFAVASAFGKFRWIEGCRIESKEVFYANDDQHVPDTVFCHAALQQQTGTGGAEPVDVSISSDHKVLCSHKNQLAVFDATPVEMIFNDHGEIDVQIPKAGLLWTVRLERPIEMTKFSGDGMAIAIVVHGEGLDNDNPYGVRTFLRDSEDGSSLRSDILEPRRSFDMDGLERPGRLDRKVSSSRSVGILYKPGPFLIHSASVSKISFRGFGHINSDVCFDEAEGNDLLLTYCRNGGTVRIFSQNSWKELIQWNAPPNTRVDWVHGISAFNLGDLEVSKRRRKSSSTTPSRRPSFEERDPSSAINADLLGNRPPTYQGPNTAAGAWIAEVTFRNGFPALRLSRLSYIKRSTDEMMPAHFESVAAILPSSSLEASTVLSMGDVGLSIQGIWPAWNPWTSETTAEKTKGSLQGSAMAFLGLSSMTPSPSGVFGEHYQAGTHGPPSELRVVASHPVSGRVILMEFPLWGDNELGGMELGSPIRYEFALSEVAGVRTPLKTTERTIGKFSPCESLDYESSILCGRIEADGKSIGLTWRKPGSMSILPVATVGDDDSVLSVCSSGSSVDSSYSRSYYAARAESDEVEMFKDISVLPVPLSLPPIRMPREAEKENLVAIKWLSDPFLSGLPRMLAVSSAGALLLYELSPPWSALEPTMPSDDLFILSAGSIVALNDGVSIGASTGETDDDESGPTGEYEVMITPHPDFGIGLRLEAQLDGMPAIAGSYKKHPLNQGRLPAEKTGVIVLGDELISVNGISLEGMSFDDIIASVRQVGTESPKGAPICMKFRPVIENRLRMNSSAFSSQRSESSATGRRTMEQMLGVKLKRKEQKGPEDGSLTPAASLSKAASEADLQNANGLVEIESQESFSHLLAYIPKALIGTASGEEMFYQSCLVPLPGRAMSSSLSNNDARGDVLVVVGEGSSLRAKRIQVSADNDPHKARCDDLGSLDFTRLSDTGQQNAAYGANQIRMVEAVPSDDECWCVVVHHADGAVRLVFLVRKQGERSDLRVDFRYYSIFQMQESSLQSKCIIRAFSVEMFAVLSSVGARDGLVSVWCATPSPVSRAEGDDARERDEKSCDRQYVQSILALDACFGSEIVDIRFEHSGSLNSFPWIVAFSPSTAVVYRKDGGSYEWKPVVALSYPSVPTAAVVQRFIEQVPRLGDNDQSLLCPSVSFPHVMPTFHALVPVSDEFHFLRSDWHPDTILAYACTAAQGVRTSLPRNVKGIFSWLSQWLHPNEDERPMVNARFPLTVVPLRDFDGYLLDATVEEDREADEFAESAAALLISSSAKKESDEAVQQKMLQDLLCPSRRGPSTESQDEPQDVLPEPLEQLTSDEIRLLWAIGEMLLDPPRLKHLDPAGQLTIFSVSLLRSLDRAKNKEEQEDSKSGTPFTVSRSSGANAGRTFLVKRASPSIPETKAVVPIASAGCLSALLSLSQGALLETCRVPNEKLNWETARLLRLPFWIRSNSQLRVVCEEIGQATFRATRDVLDCALFFIVSRNLRTLRNLAMTDQNSSGRTFAKFITDQDFSSQRGRKAAEKNAYSLLRKRRYQAAASFFLLAEPPMLKAALEIIVTQMEDLDLAFLVVRMIESPKSSGFGGGIGIHGMGGMFGAGGGYATGVAGPATSPPDDEVAYDSWKPHLGKGSKVLLNDRGMTLASHDPCLKAIQLIWLGRREEASQCLSGLSHDFDSDSDAIFPRAFDLCLDDKGATPPKRNNPFKPFPVPKSTLSHSANERVLKKANSVINFVSCPFLVKTMKASARSRWASTLLVSRALTRRGVEAVSTRLILQNTDPRDFEDDGSGTRASASHDSFQQANQHLNGEAPSMFDSVHVPDTKKTQPSRKAPPPSIFDLFDVPPQKATQSAATSADATSSSIFDGFDAPAVKKAASQVQPAAPSIFDGFDPAPPKLKPVATPAPSIFDTFDVPPPKTSTSASGSVAQPGDMMSSIFDTFGAPSPAKVETKCASTTPHSTQQDLPRDEDLEDEISDVVPLPIPEIWLAWRTSELLQSVARRLVREMASVLSRFHGDTINTPIKLFRQHIHPLLPLGAGEILNTHCLGDNLLEIIRHRLDYICASCKMDRMTIVDGALRILTCTPHPNRVVYTVLLHILVDRTREAEAIVRDVARGQIQCCESIACSNDQLVEKRKTTYHMASQYLRRLAAHRSWQLEACLWLNRGGAIPLSVPVIKEADIAIRAGLLVASWGRSHQCLEAMIRCEPNAPMDQDAGRQLWSSLKLIVGPEDKTKKTVTSGSGGWEFLVDCRRDEATEMLRSRPTGTFIIRPHAADTGVFTLSFKTNLVPTADAEPVDEVENATKEDSTTEAMPPKATNEKPVKKDDVVQHAIIRLSDAGFRCGSFGPFATLLQLLEAVSGSLPFDLLFNRPPTQGIIRDEGEQPSPNSLFFRRLSLGLCRDSYQWISEAEGSMSGSVNNDQASDSDAVMMENAESDSDDDNDEKGNAEYARLKAFGMFVQLVTLSEIRKQLCAIAAADCDDRYFHPASPHSQGPDDESKNGESVGSLSMAPEHLGVEECYAIASRIVRPLLNWCRLLETGIVPELAPCIGELTQKTTASLPVDMDASETAIELAPPDVGSSIHGGDAVIRRMIQRESGVEFRTVRVGEGAESGMIVLFSKNAAMKWLVSSGAEKNKEEALDRLARMEKRRVIEQVEMKDLGVKAFPSSSEQKDDSQEQLRYRFVDPWEVEGLESRDAETMAASLGREHFYEFSVGVVADSCESVLRRMGGLPLLGLWTYMKGGLRLTKAIASVYAPWERDAGGDLQMAEVVVTEPPSFLISIREHLYRNALFRLLKVPQRFLALVQVELLDLKNLTAPGGSPSLTVFALLRLKRSGASNRLTNKAKTLDTITTQTTRVGKSSGPNAAASWGSVARFRFPLPEDVNCDGVSYDGDREALFKGPPSVLQISVYEKKFMSDIFLGAADISLEALTGGGQLEEWVPLRCTKQEINWFARIRLTLRFELMCLDSINTAEEQPPFPPSVGLRKIQQLSRQGGAHEDAKVKKSVSTSDLLSYFESMVS